MIRPLSSSYTPRNRLASMRMRDNDRWVHTYRANAWDMALAEAHRRSFLGSLVYAVTMWTHYLHAPSEP